MSLLSDFQKWQLTTVTIKTVSSVFHLRTVHLVHHASASRELNVQPDVTRIRHESLSASLPRRHSWPHSVIARAPHKIWVKSGIEGQHRSKTDWFHMGRERERERERFHIKNISAGIRLFHCRMLCRGRNGAEASTFTWSNLNWTLLWAQAL